MKKAVSVSLGSPDRDKTVTVQLGDTEVQVQRIGTNGDMEKAAELLRQFDEDDTVHALGVGGTNLGAYLDGVYYPYRCIAPMVRYVKTTPLVDGSGLKRIIEADMAKSIENDQGLNNFIQEKGRRVFVVCGVDRWEMTMSFINAKYDYLLGDFMFALQMNIPIRRLGVARVLAKILVPLTTRFFPFEWLYPTGEQQNQRVPKYEEHYQWATVIAGDCHYIKQHMPDKLVDKVIVTNTTTSKDVDDFRKAGVKYLVTSTPTWEGRSFGTNVLEAAITAIEGRQLELEELRTTVAKLGLKPHIQVLN